jgi:hypothetical protein
MNWFRFYAELKLRLREINQKSLNRMMNLSNSSCNLLFDAVCVNIPVAPAPEAFVLDASAVSRNSSMLSNPRS